MAPPEGPVGLDSPAAGGVAGLGDAPAGGAVGAAVDGAGGAGLAELGGVEVEPALGGTGAAGGTGAGAADDSFGGAVSAGASSWRVAPMDRSRSGIGVTGKLSVCTVVGSSRSLR